MAFEVFRADKLRMYAYLVIHDVSTSKQLLNVSSRCYRIELDKKAVSLAAVGHNFDDAVRLQICTEKCVEKSPEVLGRHLFFLHFSHSNESEA